MGFSRSHKLEFDGAQHVLVDVWARHQLLLSSGHPMQDTAHLAKPCCPVPDFLRLVLQPRRLG